MYKNIFLFFALFAYSAKAELPPDIKLLNRGGADIQEDIIAQKPVVPGRLYHGSGRGSEFINTDKDGNSTLDTEKFRIRFLSTEIENPISKTRRGAYATASLRTNTYFGSWLIEMQISEECRHPKHVASVTALPKDPRFREWITSKNVFSRFPYQDSAKSADDIVDLFSKDCLFENVFKPEDKKARVWPFEGNADTPERLKFYVTAFQQAGLTLDSSDLAKRISWCDSVANAFLEENDIFIVMDEAASFDPAEAFYIRNPSCIQSVVFSPDEWIKRLTSEEYRFLFIDDIKNSNTRNGGNVCQLTSFIEKILDKSNISILNDVASTLTGHLESLPPSPDHTEATIREKILKRLGANSSVSK